MFSVPGWSITAPLKTQTGPVQVPSLTADTGAKSKSGDASSKKRKRKEHDSEDVNTKKSKTEKTETGSLDATHVQKKKDKKTKEPVEQDSKIKDVKKEKKPKKEKEHGTGSNAVDIEEGAIARLEKAKKKAEKAERAKKFQEENAEPTLESKADEKARKKDKEKKERKSEASAEVHTSNTSGTSSKSKHDSKKSREPKEDDVQPQVPSKSPITPKMTPLQSKMAAKLASARFRHLNETLYTTPSSKALSEFEKNPSTFEEYHSGFRQQVDVWPSNPVDGYISDIKRRGAVKSGDKSTKALPRTKGLCTIADLGCGDAKLASEMAKSKDNINLKILSYDLHSPSPFVERADIANLPLEDGSVNVAIFCLALMGTNWPDFIAEAYRILHWKGELWVAEIKSRFGRVSGAKDGSKGKLVEHSVGNRKKKPRSKMSEAEKKREDAAKADEDDQLAVEVDGVATASAPDASGDETDVSAFVKVLASRGFVLDGDEGEAVERGNKMFVKMRFLKAAQPTKGKNVVKGKEGATWKPKGKKFLDSKAVEDVDEGKVLKPCVYKLR